jgi:hypothetical protein
MPARVTQTFACWIAAAPALGMLLSCGATPPPRTIERTSLTVEGGEDDALRARVPYLNGATDLGRGAISLWAQPDKNELRVSLIADAPGSSARWASCRTVTFGAISARVEYIGRPMEGGVYDAVAFDLGIDELRQIASGRAARGSLCGDPIELSSSERRVLLTFVREFDRIAKPPRPVDVPAFREVGPQIPFLPIADDDSGPYPA